MRKVLVIVGPTGVGKSDLSLFLAKKYNGEIISGDSIQIYKELNIGSAKVSKASRLKVKHYLIDQYQLNEPYDVKAFQSQARALIERISEKGKLPIIVGGTGLYINAVLKDYIFLAEEDTSELEQELDAKSNQELHDLLKTLDSQSADNLHINNRQRVKRAIIIAKTQTTTKSDIVEKQDHKLLYDAHIISLTMPRELLYKRIDERVLMMDDLGLEAEVRNIVSKYAKPFELRGMFGIGYKEWKPYFENKISKEEVIKEIQKRSRNYAKRQYTWFRNQIEANWYDILDDSYLSNIFSDIDNWLNETESESDE
ncbi:MAG: tRNA (adenosine(37)-N6)-dimethylallyltransferase MiaA [Erysipelothrix sp.]|nr:tRNA (adenosine(37)-N6)-dimethylallyltransferase MiaA [Erysipelothrix sp.]